MNVLSLRQRTNKDLIKSKVSVPVGLYKDQADAAQRPLLLRVDRPEMLLLLDAAVGAAEKAQESPYSKSRRHAREMRQRRQHQQEGCVETAAARYVGQLQRNRAISSNNNHLLLLPSMVLLHPSSTGVASFNCLKTSRAAVTKAAQAQDLP